MKTQSPLVTLRELAQKEVEKAATQLGKVRALLNNLTV